MIGDPDVKVRRVAKIEQGRSGDVCFLANPKYEKYVYTCQASVILLNNDFQLQHPVQATLVRVENAYEAVASLLGLLNAMKSSRRRGWRLRFNQVSISARIGKGCYIGEFAWVGSPWNTPMAYRSSCWAWKPSKRPGQSIPVKPAP